MKNNSHLLMLVALLPITILLGTKTRASGWDDPVRIGWTDTGRGGDVGEYCQLLSLKGKPAMAYYSRIGGALKFVTAADSNGSYWNKPVTLDSGYNAGEYLSAQVINGKAAIAYKNTNRLKYIYATDSAATTWSAPQDITSSALSTYDYCVSLAEVDGRPAVAYSRYSVLFYVRANNAVGTSWGTPVSLINVGSLYRAVLKIINGIPAIAFSINNYSTPEIRYIQAANTTGTSWNTITSVLQGSSSYSIATSISLEEVNGYPAIAYFVTSSNYDLEYIRATDSAGSAAWGTPVKVETYGYAGYSPDLKVVDGFPAIAYGNSTKDSAMFVRALDSNGSSWATGKGISPNVSTYSCINIINGNPAVAYDDSRNSNLVYVRANDTLGKSWGSSVAWDEQGFLGYYLNLVTTQGKPAMIYADLVDYKILYRQGDSSGANWDNPVTVDSGLSSYAYIDATIIDGKPAVVWYDYTNIYYIIANNASGTSWGTRQTLVSSQSGLRALMIKQINNKPAVFYSIGWPDYDLKYLLATDNSGSTWGSAQTLVDGTAEVSYFDLDIIKGYPAIAFYENYVGVKYLRASDSSGSTWGSIVTVKTGSTFGQYLKITEIKGHPAITSAGSGGYGYFVRAADSTGSSWNSEVNMNARFAFQLAANNLYGIPYMVGNQPYDYVIGTVLANNDTGSSWTIEDTLATSTLPRYLELSETTDKIFMAYYNGINNGIYVAVRDLGTIWNGSTWSAGTPDSTSTALINSDNTPTTFTCGDIIINDGFSLNTGTNEVVTIHGDFNNNGNGVTGTGTLRFKKSGTAILSGDTVEHEGTVTVESGCTLSTGNKLRLLSNKNNTGRIGESAGTITGDVYAQRYSMGKRCYRLYGHPFSSSIALSQLTDEIDITGNGGSTNGFTTTPTNAASAFWFDVTAADNSTGTNPGWTAFTSANTASWDRYELMLLYIRGAKGEGLNGNSYTPSASTFEAAGTVNQGTQVITLTKGSNSNFVACGNPFPSGVQMNAVILGSNVGANYYAWDASVGADGAYVTNPWTLSYVLPAYGAFITEVSATDNITIEEADKAAGDSALFKGTAVPNMVELLIADSTTKWDRLLLNLDDNSMAVEDQKDGKKLYNPNLDFYTLSTDDVKLAVDVRPYEDGKSIPLGLTAYNRYGRYVIRTGMYDIPAGTRLILHDKYLNKQTTLNGGVEYWFDVTSDTLSQGEQRFELNMVGKPTTGILSNNKDIAGMYLSPNPATNSVKVSFEQVDGTATVQLISLTGKVLYKQAVTTTTGSVTISLSNVPTGMYIVELQSNNARFTQKLIKE